MTKIKKTLFLGIIFLFLSNCLAYADDIDNILLSAESLFKNMKKKDYPSIWVFLTEKSKEAIIGEVYKASAGAGIEYSKKQIDQDFSIGGLLSKSYWNGFLKSFDPDLALEHSKWEMGNIEKEIAYVIITYKKSDRPAVLKMFKENGRWKVGLVETFWTRK